MRQRPNTTAGSLTPASTRVLILGEDGIVGRALELLLRSANYDVRFLHATSLDELRALDGVGLVLLCPDLSAKHREPLPALVGRELPATEVPILELTETSKGVPASSRSRQFLPWPCRAENLKRRINAILINEVDSGEADNHATRWSDEKGEG